MRIKSNSVSKLFKGFDHLKLKEDGRKVVGGKITSGLYSFVITEDVVDFRPEGF